jgi:hypothetical protein
VRQWFNGVQGRRRRSPPLLSLRGFNWGCAIRWRSVWYSIEQPREE